MRDLPADTMAGYRSHWLGLLVKYLFISLPSVLFFFIFVLLTADPDNSSAFYRYQESAARHLSKLEPRPPDHNGSVSTVPRVVHLVWYYPPNTTFTFCQAAAILSIAKHIKPKRIILWHNNQPVGPWWAFARSAAVNIHLMASTPPESVYDRPIAHPAHQADISRLDILIKYGGIYMDLDVIALRSFDPLLRHDVTMGAERPDLLGNGVILAKANASFLRLWREQYRTFDDSQWNQHSVMIPMALASRAPHLVHIEWFTILRPNWDERDWLYEEGKLWDWADNYAVHLYAHSQQPDYDPFNIRTMNTTAGELLRYIYYGKPSLQPLLRR